jgi:hypothetical protein
LLSPGTVFRRAGEHDDVAVGVAHPDLRLAGPRVRVHVVDYGRTRRADALHGRLEVGDLEPEQDAVAERLVRIGQRTVVVLDTIRWSWSRISPPLTICSYSSPPWPLSADSTCW